MVNIGGNIGTNSYKIGKNFQKIAMLEKAVAELTEKYSALNETMKNIQGLVADDPK